MKNKFTPLNYLLTTVIPNDFKIIDCRALMKGCICYEIRGKIFLPSRNFTIEFELSSVWLWIKAIPDIRLLTSDFPEVKQTFDRMKIEAERGEL